MAGAKQPQFLAGRRVMVTGSGGFIGRRLKVGLQAVGAEVLELRGDVRDPAAWTQDFNLVYHLASPPSRDFDTRPEEAFEVALVGTLRVLEACRRNGAGLVLASSCGVCSPGRHELLRESDPPDPPTPYGQAKLMAETLGRSYARHHGVGVTALRLFNVYGAGQPSGFLISYLIDCVRQGRPVAVHHPDSGRDFVHVSDVVQAMLQAGDRIDGFRIYNVGSGRPRTVREIVDLVGRILGREVELGPAGEAFDPYPLIYADLTRVESDLDWRPQVELEAGLREASGLAGQE